MALRRFVEADWSSRPLFGLNSVLGLRESQYNALPPSDRLAKVYEANLPVAMLEQLLQAANQAGVEAADKKDTAQARKYFTTLKQCGEALDVPDALGVVKQIAQMTKKSGNEGLAKLGP